MLTLGVVFCNLSNLFDSFVLFGAIYTTVGLLFLLCGILLAIGVGLVSAENNSDSTACIQNARAEKQKLLNYEYDVELLSLNQSACFAVLFTEKVAVSQHLVRRCRRPGRIPLCSLGNDHLYSGWEWPGKSNWSRAWASPFGRLQILHEQFRIFLLLMGTFRFSRVYLES